MKKKFKIAGSILAVTLAMSMMSACAASPAGSDTNTQTAGEISEGGQAENEAEDKAGADSDQKDTSVSKMQETDAQEDKAEGKEEDKDSEAITVGPDYVIGEVEKKIYADDDCEADVVATINQIYILDDEYSDLYNSLCEQNDKSFEKYIASWNIDRIDDFLGTNDYTYACFPWSDDETMEVVRNDSMIFSIYRGLYEYYGTAHPYMEGLGLNYDTKSGKLLELRDVVNDYDKFYETVEQKLDDLNNGVGADQDSKEYENCLFEDWRNRLNDHFYDPEYGVCWIAYEDEINVFFNQYQLASWAVGPIDITISMDEYPQLLSDKYFHEKGIVADKERTVPEADKLVSDIMLPLADHLGEWTYDQCKDYVESKGYAAECEEPYESESSGSIVIDDSQNGYSLMILFWPKDSDCMECNKDNDAVYALWYSNEDFSWDIDNDRNEGDTQYSVTDYTTYETLKITCREDWLKIMDFAIN